MLSIIFDIDDTLYDQIIPFENACRDVLGYSLPDAEKAYHAFSFRGNEAFEACERGEISLADYRVQRISRALADCGISITPPMAEEFQKKYMDNQGKLQLSPVIRQMFQGCRDAGVQMGIITNGPLEHQFRKVEILKLLQWIPREHVFISGEVGTPKPYETIFLAAEKKMSLEKEATYMVGDSFEKDILGAANVGWHTVWMNRRHGSCSRGVTPDAIVSDENQMKDVIFQIISQFTA